MLPALSSIRAFEAAARHLSFTRAAAELNVLAPAVSRQVAALEEDLGVGLFRRTKPRLTLTPKGEIFFAAVSSGFAGIAETADAIRAQPDSQDLTVNVSIGIASCWLMPRLAAFRQAHPEVDLQLVTRDRNSGFTTDDADVVIVFGEHDLPSNDSRLIFHEELIAVGTPDMPKLDAAEIATRKLLRLRTPEFSQDWNLWFDAADVRSPPPDPNLQYNSFIIYLQEAVNGTGIALTWRTLTDDLIDGGKLKMVCDHTVKSSRGYHCCILPKGKRKTAAEDFMNWVATLA